MGATFKDQAGNTYTSPNEKPAQSGVAVTLHTANGLKPGTMSGGTVQSSK